MHVLMLLTTSLPDGISYDEARLAVHEALADDDSFCGDGGRFYSPMCDYFVIGGRWSGILAEATLGPAFEAAVSAHFPGQEGVVTPHDFTGRDREEYEAIWRSVGGTGLSPKNRDSSSKIGHPDDAMILTDALYRALLARYEGNDIVIEGCECEFVDLNFDELSPDFVGRKWIVVVDYHF